MNQSPPPPPYNSTQDVQNSRSKTKVLLFVLITLGFASTFAAGYFLSDIINKEVKVVQQRIEDNRLKNDKPNQIATSPSPTITLSPEDKKSVPLDSTKFLPGKFFFEETAYMVTKDSPHQAVLVTAVRLEQSAGYTQNSRISFFDGKSWLRKNSSSSTKDSTIVTDSIIKDWSITYDSSRLLRQSVKGAAMAGAKRIEFDLGQLANEIGMRSLPGYTKFMSNSIGTVTIDGVTHQAYTLYNRIYSSNAADIQFYNEPFGLTTDWIAFWDTSGNFYHIDTTHVDKPTPIYDSHMIGVKDEQSGRVSKTFTVNIIRSNEEKVSRGTAPKDYTVTLTGVGDSLKFSRNDMVDKFPGAGYTWIMGTMEGTVTRADGTSVSGVGLVEYIHY